MFPLLLQPQLISNSYSFSICFVSSYWGQVLISWEVCPSQLKWKVVPLTWEQSHKSIPPTWIMLFYSQRSNIGKGPTEYFHVMWLIKREMLNSPCACWLFQQKLGFPLACFHSLSPQAAPRGLHDLVSVNSRSVPKFMKRMKVPDYKDKTVFGVPLIVHVQRTGQPLPQSIQQALRYLRSNCLDQVWL